MAFYARKRRKDLNTKANASCTAREGAISKKPNRGDVQGPWLHGGKGRKCPIFSGGEYSSLFLFLFPSKEINKKSIWRFFVFVKYL